MAIFQNLGIIWKNRRHFQLQFFGVVTFMVVLVFVVNLITIKVNYENNRKNYAETTSVRTTTFTMSQSRTKGTINGVFVNYAKDRCFIVATLSNMSNMTLDANYYSMYVTNCNISGKESGTPDEDISGEIYIFAKNVIGLYLKSDRPFENNLKKLTFLSYYNMNANSSSYDSGIIYFNPGATQTRNIEFLEYHVDGEPFTLTDIMRQTNSVKEEKEIRTDIMNCYQTMQNDIKLIGEYSKRLQSTYNVSVTAFPMYIAKDKFDKIPLYDETGNEIGSYTKFIPATIVPGGTEYDWYRGSILNGYYNLVPNASNIPIKDYINGLTADKNSRESPEVKSDKWYYQDGTEVILRDKDITTALEQDVKNAIDTYEDILENYIKQKTDYQAKYLPELLKLEMNSDYSMYSYSVRNDEKTCVVY